MAYTREQVRDELKQAMSIVARTPDPTMAMLKGQPRHHFVRDVQESYGWDSLDDQAKRLPPTDKDVAWAEERMYWMRWLRDDERRQVRLHAMGRTWPWMRLADVPKHRSEPTLRKVVNKGLDEIVWCLNRTKPKIRQENNLQK